MRPVLLAMVIAGVLQTLLVRIQLQALRRLLVKLSVSFSGQFIWHLLCLPISFYARRFPGEISRRSEQNARVASALSGRLAITVIDTVTMGFYALLMFAYDWKLTCLTIGFAGFNFFALRLVARSRIDAKNTLLQESDKLSGVAIGGIQAIETVKASGLEADVFSRFAGYYTKVLNAQQILALPTYLLAVLPTLLIALAIASVLVFGGFRVLNGNLSIGMLVAYQLLTISFLRPINDLVNFGSILQELDADLNRRDDVLQNPIDSEARRPAEKDPSEAQASNIDTSSSVQYPQQIRLKGDVELRHLSFGYSHLEAPLIQDFSLTVKPGQRVALVGTSGSGKSTIAKLLSGLYQPWEGQILLDGTPRTQISRSVLANSLAMVEQDIFLFAGTVWDNLTLWDRTIPEADIIRAATDAEIHEAILHLPGGYNAQLSEAGSNLSGGQRQRLEIARALVRNPAMLILDEATSALDAETERLIDRNLRRRGCSCIVVAHRLSTIRDCDEIIVLERGNVVQRGTHEALREQVGAPYERLIRD